MLRLVAFTILLAWVLLALVIGSEMKSEGQKPLAYVTAGTVAVLMGLIQALVIRVAAKWLETRPCPRCGARLHVEPGVPYACPHCGYDFPSMGT